MAEAASRTRSGFRLSCAETLARSMPTSEQKADRAKHGALPGLFNERTKVVSQLDKAGQNDEPNFVVCPRCEQGFTIGKVSCAGGQVRHGRMTSSQGDEQNAHDGQI